MVTAGIYLLLRVSFILNYSFSFYTYISTLGMLTAVVSAIMGLLQTDIKSIIAYSTASQLGYMCCCCGFFGYSIAFFHLFNHAFLKSLLFLSAGLVIHAFSDEQDIRRMGGLFFLLPVVYVFFIVGSFSLMGLPFLSGYYSKDLLLEYLYCLPFF